MIKCTWVKQWNLKDERLRQVDVIQYMNDWKCCGLALENMRQRKKKKCCYCCCLILVQKEERIYFDHRTVLKWFDVLSMLLSRIYVYISELHNLIDSIKISR
jgi:hypothetical protein